MAITNQYTGGCNNQLRRGVQQLSQWDEFDQLGHFAVRYSDDGQRKHHAGWKAFAHQRFRQSNECEFQFRFVNYFENEGLC